MKGHLRERSPGRWAIILDVRDPATGKRKRRWHSFAGTKRAAQVECARLIAEAQHGTVVNPNRLTLDAFFDQWLDYMRSQIGPRAHERYTEIARKNLVPLLGPMALLKLQPTTVSQAYAKALASGRRDGRGGLSPRSVTYMHRILRHALKDAVRWRLLAHNPTDAVDPPKVERRRIQVLDADGTARLIEAARETTLFIPILLAAALGLRRGEITALRWRAVDLDRGQASIEVSTEQTRDRVREKSPKSGRGRAVALPALVIDELRQHRLRQAESLLRLGVRLTEDHHVVMRADGLPLQPRSITHAFDMFLRTRGLPHVRLHDLRHGHATQMLASGIHPKIAQERLGHSSIAVTLDLYSHVLPGMQADAAAKVDGALRAALNKARRSKG
jgi:integrase